MDGISLAVPIVLCSKYVQIHNNKFIITTLTLFYDPSRLILNLRGAYIANSVETGAESSSGAGTLTFASGDADTAMASNPNSRKTASREFANVDIPRTSTHPSRSL